MEEDYVAQVLLITVANKVCWANKRKMHHPIGKIMWSLICSL